MPLFSEAIANLRGRPARSSSPWPSYIGLAREGSIELTDGATASYTTLYHENVWVRAAVNKIASGMMRMPAKVYRRNGRTKERFYDGDLYRLLERRPMAGWTPSRFREGVAKSTAIFGNAIAVKLGMQDESSTPTEVMLAPATGWTVGSDDDYVWTSRAGDKYPFKRWQIIHFRFWDTDENGFGVSPLEALRKTLANDDAARRYSFAAFKNGARPGSVLKTDQVLTKEVAERLKAEFQALHGSVDNAFKLAVLQQGLDFAVIEHNLEKAAVVAHRELTPIEVAAAYDIPPAMIGWQKDANFASIDMYHTMLYQDSLGPWVVMTEETLQLDLVDPTPAFDGLFVEIDMNAVMRGDYPSRIRAHATAITTGQKTANEIRALENDPPSDQPEADMLLFPLNLAGAVGAQLAEDTGQGGTPNAGA